MSRVKKTASKQKSTGSTARRSFAPPSTSTSERRVPFFRHIYRPQRFRHKLTPAEQQRIADIREARKKEFSDALKAVRKVIREQAQGLHARFGRHSVDYYHRLILQTSTKNITKHKISLWNVFQKSERERMIQDGTALAGDGASKLAAAISAKWKTLTPAEKVEATQDHVAAVEQQRKSKAIGAHNVTVSTFNNTQRTLRSIQDELVRLHARTKAESFLITVKGDASEYGAPYVFSTSKKGEDFIYSCVFKKTTLSNLGVKFGAYCISGVGSVLETYQEQINASKSNLCQVLAEKLSEAAGVRISRMEYESFDTRITARYSVVVEGWPLKKFAKPSSIGCTNGVDLLQRCLRDGITRFRKLSPEELHRWHLQRDQHQQQSPSSPSAVPSPSLSESATLTAVGSSPSSTPTLSGLLSMPLSPPQLSTAPISLATSSNTPHTTPLPVPPTTDLPFPHLTSSPTPSISSSPPILFPTQVFQSSPPVLSLDLTRAITPVPPLSTCSHVPGVIDLLRQCDAAALPQPFLPLQPPLPAAHSPSLASSSSSSMFTVLDMRSAPSTSSTTASASKKKRKAAPETAVDAFGVLRYVGTNRKVRVDKGSKRSSG